MQGSVRVTLMPPYTHSRPCRMLHATLSQFITTNPTSRSAAYCSQRFDEIMSDIEGGMFGDKEYFKPLVDSISNMKVGNDWFLVANDFASYLEAQEEVDKVWAVADC